MCARYLNNKQDERYSKLYSKAGAKYMKTTRENENQQYEELNNNRERQYFIIYYTVLFTTLEKGDNKGDNFL